MPDAPDKKLSLKITQVSLNQTAFDFPRNMANIYAAIDAAVEAGSDILSLEELALTGYDAGDDFQKTDNKVILELLEDIAAYAYTRNPNLIVSVGHPWRLSQRNVEGRPHLQQERAKNAIFNRLGLPFNVQTIISGGEIQGMTAKTYLFNYERGYEKRYFQEWSMRDADEFEDEEELEEDEYDSTYGTIRVHLREDDERTIPFGRPIFYVTDGENRFFLTQVICEEKWVATIYDGGEPAGGNYPWDNVIPSISRHLRNREGIVTLIADASPPGPGKIEKHEYLARLASDYVELVVNTDGLGSSGATFAQMGHRLIAQDGKVIASGERLKFARTAAMTTTVEIGQAPPGTSMYTHAELSHQFNTQAAPASVPAATWDRPDNPHRTSEESIRMAALWLFDYMRKTKARGLAQALSGGMDSAFNSALVYTMVHLAVKELGIEGFCREMSHLPYKDKILAAAKQGGDGAAIEECLTHMLTNVYMGTNNSSDRTRNAARGLIEGGSGYKGIGGVYMERNVQDLLDFYGLVYAVEDTTAIDRERLALLLSVVSEHLNLKPGSVTPQELADREASIKAVFPEVKNLMSAANPAQAVAYENIQAAARQVLIKRIANAEGKIALANPNLDEARNGYSTFGGDLHAGEINLNAPFNKDFQIELMRYLYNNGLEGVMPPVRAFELVLKNKPSAELQPKDASGKVVQNDEDSLKGSFAQLNAVAGFMLQELKDDGTGMRRLNAGEIFERCLADDRFKGIDEDRLYEMLRFRYERWTIAQHKIHASPIAPTYGKNVDHQVSLRTPNLSGGSRDELAKLGVRLLFKWAAEEGVALSSKKLAAKRAMQDETFNDALNKNLRSLGGLRGVYDEIRAKGWDAVFPPLAADHPLSVMYGTKPSL